MPSDAATISALSHPGCADPLSDDRGGPAGGTVAPRFAPEGGAIAPGEPVADDGAALRWCEDG